MKEKLITGHKNGMAVLLLILLLYAAAVVGIIWAAITLDAGGSPAAAVVMAVSILWVSLGWIFLCGLKVLKPQEALVLTLFGKYVGTLKGEGFYYVNPFCSGVNPAAKTRLNQSGDVDGGGKAALKVDAETAGKRISLKLRPAVS